MAKGKKKPIEQYEHLDKRHKNNPPAGLVTPDTDRDGEKKISPPTTTAAPAAGRPATTQRTASVSPMPNEYGLASGTSSTRWPSAWSKPAVRGAPF